MSQKGPALKLLTDLIEDISDPSFIWQALVLVVCMVLAAFISRWWQAKHGESRGRLKGASARLVFPFTGMLSIGLAEILLHPFIHVNLLKLAIPLLGAMALVRGLVFVLRQAFPNANWLASWSRIITILVWSWGALYITDLMPHMIAAFEKIEFTLGSEKLNLWVILRGLVTVFLTIVIALWVSSALENKLMKIDKLDSSLRIVSVRVIKALLAVVAIFISLSLVGIDMTALSVFTGALGVGLGFGLQKIASNYVSGFIILLDRSIRIGNVVQVGTDSGMVTRITTRYTVLRHPGGTEFIVPNETLISGVVQNQTFTDSRLRLTTSVGVAYDADLELAMQLMVRVAVDQPRVLSDPGPKVFLTLFGDSSITLELGFWIADPEDGRGNIISDVNLAIWKIFRENGIQIPFPQREIRVLNTPPV